MPPPAASGVYNSVHGDQGPLLLQQVHAAGHLGQLVGEVFHHVGQVSHLHCQFVQPVHVGSRHLDPGLTQTAVNGIPHSGGQLVPPKPGCDGLPVHVQQLRCLGPPYPVHQCGELRKQQGILLSVPEHSPVREELPPTRLSTSPPSARSFGRPTVQYCPSWRPLPQKPGQASGRMPMGLSQMVEGVWLVQRKTNLWRGTGPP